MVGCVADPQAASHLPTLIDQRLGPMNLIGTEILIGEYEARNSGRLQELLGRTSLVDQQELKARMADRGLRWELRLLYAAILAAQGEASGQRFLIEQTGSTPPAKLPAVFNAIRLAWRMQSGKTGHGPDMAWASATMLAAIADLRTCNPEYLYDSGYNEPASVGDLAIRHGDFEFILAQQHCPEAVAAFVDFLNRQMKSVSAKSPRGSVFATAEGEQVVRALAQFDDPRIEAVMLAVAKSAVQLDNDSEALRDSFRWLVAHRAPSAMEVIRHGLLDDNVYSALAGQTPPFLPFVDTVRTVLPELQDGKLTGCALSRQRTARANAELILILADESDPVPKLMAFASDRNNENRHFAVYLLKSRKDPRAVPWAKSLAQSDSYWFLPFCLIELLGEIPGNEASRALAELSSATFNKINMPADVHYTARDYRMAAAKALADRTDKKPDDSNP